MITDFRPPLDPQESDLFRLKTYLPQSCVTTVNYKSAVQMSLEVLGTQNPALIVPVIMPVSVAPSTAAAAVHSRAALILMDVDEDTLQMNPTELSELLDELDNQAIVVFNRPGGQPVHPDLLGVVFNRVPVVVDSRLTPKLPLEGDDLAGDFIVYDIGYGHEGAFVLHRYAEQLAEMREWRSGPLGHSADLTPSQASRALRGLANQTATRADEQQIVSRYQRALKDKVQILFTESPHWPYLVVQVPDADLALAHLKSARADVHRAVTPLHTLKPVRDRFAEEDNPEYARAEALSKKLITLPVHPHLLKDDGVERLCELLCEVAT